MNHRYAFYFGLVVLLAACGPGGSFRLGTTSYSADNLTATFFSTDPTLEGVTVTLKSNPTGSASAASTSVVVDVYWAVGARPPVNQDVSVGLDLAVRATARVACPCSGTSDAVSQATVTGTLHLTRFDSTAAGGDFNLTFNGAVPLVSGGVLNDNETLKVNAQGFFTGP